MATAQTQSGGGSGTDGSRSGGSIGNVGMSPTKRWFRRSQSAGSVPTEFLVFENRPAGVPPKVCALRHQWPACTCRGCFPPPITAAPVHPQCCCLNPSQGLFCARHVLIISLLTTHPTPALHPLRLGTPHLVPGCPSPPGPQSAEEQRRQERLVAEQMALTRRAAEQKAQQALAAIENQYSREAALDRVGWCAFV